MNSPYTGSVYGNSANGSGDVNDAIPHGVAASTSSADNNNNTVTVRAAVTNGYVYGTRWGTADGAGVTNNAVNIHGSWNMSGIIFLYGGYTAGSGTVTDNAVYIGKDKNGNGTYSGTVSANVYGGYSYSGNAYSNRVFISSGTFTGNIYGGRAYTGTATGNTVNISGSPTLTTSTLYGGLTSGVAGGDAFTGNTLELHTSGLTVASAQNFQFYNFYPPSGAANGTMLTVTGTANINNSTIGIIGQPALNLGDSGILISNTTGTPTNLGNYTDTTTGISYGYDLSIDAGTTLNFFHNSVNASGNWIAPHANYAADSSNGDVSLKVGGVLSGISTLTLNQNSGNTLTADIHTLDARSNDLTVSLNGTTVWNDVTKTGVRFDTLELGGGHTFSLNDNGGTGAYSSFSTYNIRGQAAYNGNLNAANANLNFYVPVGAPAGATMLNVTGNADITDSKVNVNFDGANPVLQANDQIKLIDAAGGLTGEPSGKTSVQWSQGVTFQYEFDITADSSSKQLLATVTATSVNPQTKSFSEARLSQLAFTNQGSDLVAEQGLSAALDATANRTERRTTTFGAISGGSSRYKTGSHSDVTGLSLIAGLAGNSRLTLGKLTLGAFFEYGNANYDSYNSFTNAPSVRGNGGIDYTGGGVLAHFEFSPTAKGNAWLESSARFGRATVDFKTNDMLGNLGKRTAFDSDSNYAAAHIGTGYHWKLTKQNGFDLYAQYLWSRQNADSVELTTNETVKFETANSERLRLGSRFVYNLNPHRRAYAGIAWEHEFDGESNASISGFQLDSPKLTGDTCKLELGLTLQPTKTCPVTRNFGIQGYTGKREGVAGSVEVRWEF